MVVQPKRGAVAVADLRIAGARRCGIAVVDRADQAEIVVCLKLEANKRGRQRVVGAARRQIEGRHDGKAEARIHKQRAILGEHQLVVGAFLAEPHRQALIEETLIEPEVVQLDARRRLEAADDLLVADEAARRPMAMNIVGVDQELGAGPADRLVEIDIELCRGQPVVAGGPPPAARQIAPDLALLL